MKQDYWNVSEEQVIEKTGKKIADWVKILDKFPALEKKSNDVLLIYKLNIVCLDIGKDINYQLFENQGEVNEQ